ncbi:MAG: glycosyltransferase [Bacteroidaceae bacterium]|nr:glycosyltransferase [Bacteroidaceae bacterium]
MRLSIIVPVYKVEKYLSECIDSILSQTFTNYELILIDDGSPDRCGIICDDYARKDNRIRVIHQKNGGLSAARNAGLDVAQGEYIAFVDSDDFIAHDYFDQAMQVCANYPSTQMVVMPVHVHYGHTSSHLYMFPQSGFIHGCDQIFTSWISHQGYLHTYSCCHICHRTLFQDIRFPIGQVFEDADVTPRLLSICNNIYYHHTSSNESGVYYYRYREDSITTTAKWRDYHDQLNHQFPWLNKACQHTNVTLADTQRYGLILVNIVIDLLRTIDVKLKSELNMCNYIYSSLNQIRPSVSDLLRLPIPIYNKVKNLPFAIFGLKFHLFLYTRKWLPTT